MGWHMSVFLDGLILVVLLLFTLNGIRKGIVRSIISFIGITLAVFLSSFLGRAAAELIYSSFIKQGIIDSVSSSVSNTIGQGTDSIIREIMDCLPDFITVLVPELDSSDYLTDAINSGADSAAYAVEKLVSPIITGVISVFAVILIFLLLIIIVRLISNTVARTFQIPVLLGINRVFGGVLGFLSGSVFIMLVVLIIRLIASLTSDNTFITQQVYYQTYLFRFFNSFNIFDFILFSGIGNTTNLP